MRSSTMLRKLIRACVDDECTLRHESKLVDLLRATSLERMASERWQFVVALGRFAKYRRERPGGSWPELLREAARNLSVALAGRNDGDAIATCRRSSRRTEARYREALKKPWPEDIRLLLSAQRHRLEDEARELDRLQF